MSIKKKKPKPKFAPLLYAICSYRDGRFWCSFHGETIAERQLLVPKYLKPNKKRG